MMNNKKKSVLTLTKGIEFLFKKNKIAHFKGLGVLKSKNEILIIDENKNEKTIEAEKIIISSGSEPISFPGTKFDEQNIVSSTGALSLKSVPKKLVIIGYGSAGRRFAKLSKKHFSFCYAVILPLLFTMLKLQMKK